MGENVKLGHLFIGESIINLIGVKVCEHYNNNCRESTENSGIGGFPQMNISL